ncbi:MFS transporter [candidate division KSB1 bacterium]|nr:MFS transporter [candidate division KSB1 bacterium]
MNGFKRIFSYFNTRTATVPSLYFAEGLPYIIVNSMSVVMYKSLGVSNQVIGLTSIIYLPWVIKMFWSPLIDLHSSKRRWITGTQYIMAALFFLSACSLWFGSYLYFSLAFFVMIAFTSATHDIAVDGFYMMTLTQKEQAFFVGIRATFYRIAMLFGSGMLVVIAGIFEDKYKDIPLAWMITLGIGGLVMLILFAVHQLYLPHPDEDTESRTATREKVAFLKIFRIYFSQKKIIPIVLFVLFYRLGEAVLSKMTVPFLKETPQNGGLGLSTETVGYVFGTVGTLSLVIGGILGGWLISRFGLKKCIWPMALILKAPDIVYVYMAIAKPSLTIVYPLVAIEQFGYGVGFTAYMVFLMTIAKGAYKTSMFAISTGLMALGMMIPGLVSGYLQNILGYTGFFIVVMCLTVPGLLILFFIPLDSFGAIKD